MSYGRSSHAKAANGLIHTALSKLIESGKLIAAQRVYNPDTAEQQVLDVDDESTRLRRALDGAIYALEQIRRRAESGSMSDNGNWDCLVIAEAAEAAIERISERCRSTECEAQHPALKNETRYRATATV